MDIERQRRRKKWESGKEGKGWRKNNNKNNNHNGLLGYMN